MVQTFTRLHFGVRVYSNLTVKDINNMLEKVSLEDHHDRDMLAVVVLTHGNEGILYGYDHSYPAHKIWEHFTADRCKVFPDLMSRVGMVISIQDSFIAMSQ